VKRKKKVMKKKKEDTNNKDKIKEKVCIEIAEAWHTFLFAQVIRGSLCIHKINKEERKPKPFLI
jgi:hypothetical protein